MIPEPWGDSPTQTALTTLSQFLTAITDAPERWRAILVLADSSTPTFRRHLDRARAMLVTALEDLVHWATTEGLDEDTDVDLLARALLAIMWDSARLVLAQPDQFPPERILAFAERTVARHLSPTAT